MAGEPERRLEGLYTLKYGITEQLIAEGLSGVVGAHTVENVQDRTIQRLLADQETAYNMLFADIAGGRPLTQSTPSRPGTSSSPATARLRGETAPGLA